MKRRLFHLAAAVSAVLCVATVTLWVRSRFVLDLWRTRGYPPLVIIASGDGDAFFFLEDDRLPFPENERGRLRLNYEAFRPKKGLVGELGASLGSPPGVIPTVRLHLTRDGRQVRFITAGLFVRWWTLTISTVVLPALSTARWLRESRRPRGHCAKGGYDLRATPDRCPECGHVPARAGDGGSARRQGLE